MISFIKTPSELILLDKILEFLYNSRNLKASYHSLEERFVTGPVVHRISAILKNPNKSQKVDGIGGPVVLKSALEYLQDEKMIKTQNGTIYLQYHGVVKHLSNNYRSEYLKLKINTLLQRVFWVVAAMSFILSLIALLLPTFMN
ncbi:hypothetical protein V1387_12775 [Allomuricauda taeanensis]|uniref:hypothetical protein n=1 Tax=Flagellimonas taeanensis TaxID=1005926 RepID=UPI002E7C53FE|nr:hypothetical protein [Allomuricauda taeanensis]MEE1963564.1 hypothetical protein [Allomuricauda taeanensis]